MTEQRSGGGARSIRRRGDRPSENGLAGWRGRGARSRRCIGVAVTEPGRGCGSRPSDVDVGSKTPRAEITDAAPDPPLRKLGPRGSAGLQSEGHSSKGRRSEGLPAAAASPNPALSCAPGAGARGPLAGWVSRHRGPSWKLHLSSGDILWALTVPGLGSQQHRCRVPGSRSHSAN